MLKRFVRDERAATAIEYGLIAAIISLAIMIGAGGISAELRAMYEHIGDTVQAASGP